MRRAIFVALLFAANGCGDSHSGEELLGPIAFEVPPTWHRTDTHGRTTASAVFAPAMNGRKESIAVIRTELGPIAEKYTPSMLSNLLLQTQSSFPRANVAPVARVSTAGGYTGARVEVDYVPPGRTDRYHRVHAVLLDGTALIHVMYTAASPDAEIAVFQRVIDSLHEES